MDDDLDLLDDWNDAQDRSRSALERDNRPEAVAQRKAEKRAQRASQERMEQYENEAIF